MECMKNENEKTMIPVFYGVDATNVQYQSKSFAEAFAKHELKYKHDDEGMQKVQIWRTALTAAANLKGYVFPNGVDSDCIERIVDDISSKCKTLVSYSHKVVGIDTQIEKVESLLEMEIDDVRIVWICGMGGVSKTTIANAIYNKLSSSKFKDACFLEDIKETKHKMYSLQNILLSKLLGEKENCVNNKEGRSLMARRLRFKKVLLVLNDIDQRDQLDYLAGDLRWFGKGSRIIATSRDKCLIRNSVLHEVETLLDRDAIKLFNQYAFMENVPDECFEYLTLEIVSHAKGHPLALKVWGSLLYKKDIIVWRSALDRIRENSGSEIIENLKISCDGLEPNEQEIFLDIACFFRGKEKEKVMQILESCDFPAEYGLRVLIDKSLVFISDHNKIQMHDLIQDMGQYIVKMQKHPGERSTLWKIEDVKEVMVDNTGTMAVEGICFTFIQKLCFSKEAMKNMKRPRILHICSFITPIDRGDVLYDSNCHDGSIEYLPNNLCWFVWHEFPWKSLPENFEPQRLVHLDLQWSSLHDLWTERKVFLLSLRKLDVSYSKSLMRTPDFTGMPNLEYLNLRRCTSLKEVPHSLGCSIKLIELDLYHCEKLEWFPCVNVESLKYLDLVGCSSLEKFPEILGKMKLELEIRMGLTWIRELPSYVIQHQARLRVLALSDMKNLVALPSSICKLKVLMKLDVSYCSKLESLPEEIGDLEKLEEFHASHTLISHPPSSIICLNKLKFLTFAKKELEDGVYFVFPQNILSSQHDISASDSLSLRLFTSRTLTIPTWFHRRGTGKSGLVNLPENLYVADNFLGFAVCYTGRLMYVTMTTHLIPLCYGVKLWMTLKLDLLEPDSNSLVCEYSPDSVIHFFFIPFAGLWDTSKANGKTPNDCGRIMLSFSGDIRDYGFRLLYKDLCIGARKSKYDDSTVTNEASCSSSKKQRSHF
ncbi:hypothetical protein H5410_001203 [Solanum commersonii]|uniref:ADP-ribosyl cyclase/cyclic ADP-ribose hydrolase n=1 Tax=Solanum commersonii TaxID=4109 RepID=A0A9J6AY95_SOLCO|nr:hypothetical protein H5410_001203 [Solanum commersonii]